MRGGAEQWYNLSKPPFCQESHVVSQPTSFEQLPADLPVPEDDGACAHLVGCAVPSLALTATDGSTVNLAALPSRTLVYCYPRTGVPGQALPTDWDTIPGARGCTPEACGFRDHHAELRARGTTVFGLSTQDTAYQQEFAARLHLPFAILSDAEFRLTTALRLPTFTVDGMRLIKRLTLVLHDGVIEHVFYPIFPPDTHAGQVVAWLADHQSDLSGVRRDDPPVPPGSLWRTPGRSPDPAG
nr:peroxiredoxin [Candidatus Chloroploca mongolica]